MITDVVKQHFLDGKTMKVIHLREIYSETEQTLLDKRTFARLCAEAGIKLTTYSDEIISRRLTTRKILTPAQLKKFKDLHGNPFTD